MGGTTGRASLGHMQRGAGGGASRRAARGPRGQQCAAVAHHHWWVVVYANALWWCYKGAHGPRGHVTLCCRGWGLQKASCPNSPNPHRGTGSMPTLPPATPAAACTGAWANLSVGA